MLDALGPEGYLVNIARGSVVDEPVLLKYLQEKKIAGAGLDVFADEPRVPPEFFALDNAVLFPHVGSATHGDAHGHGQPAGRQPARALRWQARADEGRLRRVSQRTLTSKALFFKGASC